jgi:recombination protein RecA
MERMKKSESLSTQMKRHIAIKPTKKAEYDGNTETMISTGSTLLDLAISGGRVRGGGIPGGIFVEVFGPESSGKTVLLCETAGDVQRKGGQSSFHDPEARLNKQFAQIFDLRVKDKDYTIPDTVTELFNFVVGWKPDDTSVINGVFGDSLAALSTNLEMEEEEGDKMGMRRAKEFSEGLRKACRIIKEKNYLMMCSNQIRETMNVSFGKKTHSPGGKALAFYASLRIEAGETQKTRDTITVAGKKVEKVIGVRTKFEVAKSSIWKPFRWAWVTIIFDYGVDDIRENLQFIKDFTANKTYTVNGVSMGIGMDEAIAKVEKLGLQKELKEEVTDLWEDIEAKFDSNRAKKVRE